MTLGTLSAIAGVAGAATSAAGTLVSGIAAGDAAKYQSEVAANNAKTAAQNAAYSAHAGQAKAQDTSMKGAANNAMIRAAIAAGGVDVNSGSALDVQQSAREESNLNTQRDVDNASLQSYGYRTQETGFEAQSKLDSQTAQQAPIGAAFGAAGSLLSNASAIGMKPGFFGNPATPGASTYVAAPAPMVEGVTHN